MIQFIIELHTKCQGLENNRLWNLVNYLHRGVDKIIVSHHTYYLILHVLNADDSLFVT